jgi:nardilysin
MASVCEIGSAFSSNDGGFALRVNGFDDKLLSLFLILLETILKFRNSDLKDLPDTISRQQFDITLEKYRRSCHNAGMKAQNLGSNARVRCLRPGSFSARQRVKAIENIDVPIFLQTTSEILNKIGAEGFFHGNVDLPVATEAKDKIISLLKGSQNGTGSGGLVRKKYPTQFVLQLPPKTFTLTLAAKDPTETNSSVEVYFQVGKDNTHDRVMVDLLMEILYEPMYNQIRTKDQFGYSVSCDARWTDGIIGLHFCVVTSSKTAQETEDRIERFLLEYRQTLVEMSAEDFMEHLVALATVKLNMFHSLSEESGHYWSEIRDGRYKWEVERDEVICLKTITKDAALKAYDEWLWPESKKRRRLVVKVVANEGTSSAGRPDVDVENIEDYNDQCVAECHSFCKNQTYGRIY